MITFFLVLLFAAAFAVIFAILLAIFERQDKHGKWFPYPENPPPEYYLEQWQTHYDIRAYPVAIFDEEFGVIVDMADYHPGTMRWVYTSDGRECHPYAWYDLPYPAHPNPKG